MMTATISASDAAELFCVPETLLRQLPMVKIIPKFYTPSTIEFSTAELIVNVPEVYQLGLRQHHYGLLDKSFNRYQSDLRFMAATALPFFTRSINKLEWGIYCKGCDGAGRNSMDNRDPFYAVFCRIKHLGKAPIAYTEEGFLEHLQVCEEAEKLCSEEVDE
jgi:hypothetical protein